MRPRGSTSPWSGHSSPLLLSAFGVGLAAFCLKRRRRRSWQSWQWQDGEVHSLTWGTQSAYFCLGTHGMESQHEEFGECLQQSTWQQYSSRAPMNEENQLLLTDQLVEFEKWPVQIQDFRKFSDWCKGIYGFFFNWIPQNNRNMLPLSRLASERLGFRLVVPQKFHGHCWLFMLLHHGQGHKPTSLVYRYYQGKGGHSNNTTPIGLWYIHLWWISLDKFKIYDANLMNIFLQTEKHVIIILYACVLTLGRSDRSLAPSERERERDRSIIYTCTSRPCNIRPWPTYKFVADSSQVMTLATLIQGLLNRFRCPIN